MIHPTHKLKARLNLLATVVDQIGEKEIYRHLQKCMSDLQQLSPGYTWFTPNPKPFLSKQVMHFFYAYTSGELDQLDDLVRALKELALHAQDLANARDEIVDSPQHQPDDFPR